MSHTSNYTLPGRYEVPVTVIDIFGNDKMTIVPTDDHRAGPCGMSV